MEKYRGKCSSCLLTVLSIVVCGRSCSNCVLTVLKILGDEGSDLDTIGIPSGADRAVAAELAQKLDDTTFWGFLDFTLAYHGIF